MRIFTAFDASRPIDAATCEAALARKRTLWRVEADFGGFTLWRVEADFGGFSIWPRFAASW
jgi:hypothetical protein